MDVDAVRVTVAAGLRRADLVLPGGVPVAELLPELAGGLLGERVGRASLAHPAGPPLSPEAGLRSQGVTDGTLLWLTLDQPAPPATYDDAEEAIADLGRPRGGRLVQALALRRAERRQAEGAVDVDLLRTEIRLLARLQLLATLCLLALVAGAVAAWLT